jgi:hypothetical protein
VLTLVDLVAGFGSIALTAVFDRLKAVALKWGPRWSCDRVECDVY